MVEGGGFMLTKRIIPCLDVKEGRVVKGVQFVSLRDAGDPVELAKFYDEQGADELVFLDISASHEGRETMVDVVRQTAATLAIPFTVGGGIRTLDDMKRILRAGADKVSVNTSALERPELIKEGSDFFLVPNVWLLLLMRAIVMKTAHGWFIRMVVATKLVGKQQSGQGKRFAWALEKFY